MLKKRLPRKTNTRLIATTSLLVAMTFIATAFIKIGTPGGTGYIHVGDAVILVSCYFLPMPYAIAVGAIGAALADWAAGYVPYILITILAKSVLVVSTHFVIYNKKIITWYTMPVILIGNIISLFCYAFHDWIFFGKGAFVANLTFGLIQPAVAVISCFFLILTFSKIPVLINFKEMLNPKKYAYKRIKEEAMHIEQNLHAQELRDQKEFDESLSGVESDSLHKSILFAELKSSNNQTSFEKNLKEDYSTLDDKEKEYD